MNQKRITIKKSTIKLALLLVLLKVTLDLAYVYIISPIYAYSGFTVLIHPVAVIESYILVFIIGLVLPFTINRASHFLLWMLGVGALIPTLSYYAMHSGSRAYMYAMFLSFLCVVLVSKLPPVRISTLKEGRTIAIIVLVIMVFAVTASLIAKGGLSHFNLDLSKVYEHRREVGAVISTGLWGYINTWVFKVINPALIGWALWQKKYRLVALFIALQVIFFGISSHKSVLFYPVLILAVYFFVKIPKALRYMTWGIIGIIVVSSLSTLLFDYNWLSSLFIRRVFFVPAQLNFAYYELFSEIGYVYLSNSVLSQLVHYPFPYPPQMMISNYLFGHYNTWANNGFLATSYMHFGYMGMLIFSAFVGLLFWLVDILVHNRLPLWLGISIVAIPFFSLFTSADLSTALLTHGILIALLILLIIGSSEQKVLLSNSNGGLHEKDLSSKFSSPPS
ncbi:MAG TPA: hypothetical protein DD791_02495 [Syntrophomonas sp.]|jgi:hypothetical protein|nr:hypothetical protein [Syntrophomonas sp.]